MTFKIIVRGSPAPFVAAEYLCEQHGRFEIDIERDASGDAPDVIACPYDDCGRTAEWCISAPLARVRRFEVVKGKSEKPERPTWTDTRNIGEGQPVYEWREDRAKVWEEQRKRDVMAFAREHNERVIGGD